MELDADQLQALVLGLERLIKTVLVYAMATGHFLSLRDVPPRPLAVTFSRFLKFHAVHDYRGLC